jgi:beta-ketoacyl-acyl-carrier-protein synthase II
MTDRVDARGRLRVVITGMGAMTPLGHTVAETWESALSGRSGIATITQFDASGLPCRIAGEVKDFEPGAHMNFKAARRMARASQLAVAAAGEAMTDAGLPTPVPAPERTGVIIGTGFGGFDWADENLTVYREKGMARANPFGLVSALPNMPSHHVSHLSGSQGPINTVVAACATGVQAIGEGADLIRRGRADLVLAGGVEGLVHEATMAGFAAMRALSTAFNDEPYRASRPFDLDRDGFILSEGAVVLVLERLDHALARGARIYAEYLGYASSSDAYHVAVPEPQGRGAIQAMHWALEDAGITAADIDYINAHGSSTPANDSVETLAIKQVFGDRAYKIPVSSTKSVSGHLLGGAGAIETLFCALALFDGVIPPTWNYETPDPSCDLDYVPNEPRRQALRHVLNNAFGLGGQNACLVLRRFE